MTQAEYSPIEALLADVAALPVSDSAKVHFLAALRRQAGQRIHFSKSVLVRPVRVSMACKLLDQGMSRAQAKALLCERLGISANSSYRLIGKAMHQRFMAAQLVLFEGAEHG